MTDLEQLLIVQEHDSALDRLRHRRATLPEREALAQAEAHRRSLAPELAEARERRDRVAREAQRLDDESASLEAKAVEVDRTMYSGTISSPKELQSMQAEIDQLRARRSTLDDQALELLEQQETLDAEVGALEARDADLLAAADGARAALAREEAEIDAELATEVGARDGAAAGLPEDLLRLYASCREKARGVGVARLVGNTCQGCRLTIPATEVDRIKRHAAEGISHCDNCGAILVP